VGLDPRQHRHERNSRPAAEGDHLLPGRTSCSGPPRPEACWAL